MSDQRYPILLCDPPWDYKGQTQHGGTGVKDTGSAAGHYPTLTLKQLMDLDVQSITADDALMFMWSSSPHLDQAVTLLKVWGFQWATVGFVWDKQRVNPGFYTMSQCELCLVGKRGRIPRPRGARNVRQLVSAMRGEHSEKPGEVRERIVAMFPHHRRVELFARERSDGWDAWGNEVQSDVELKFKGGPHGR
jgi:N6-adenosine-specific RNA methylase IME4